MSKIKISVGDKSYLQNALEINEEIQALLGPLLKLIEEEADTDTHLKLRAVHRLSMCQYHDLNTLNNNFK
ncbi:hypothetical protein [Xenorhabdus miraniensis]|uniref:Uncharacterized protein n=1 Tax=Xenorhabdus miraniensis TaxID=351674 RepID=A0A2D0JJJ2_9GAMM|nr:hypothetical protein [Xenorhabdus miraniensis]PHM45601.1 hypothetical protein Xmir_04235 [Xenorhabdus miraniensis]